MAKILVVDDSEAQRFELRHEFEAAGFEVVEAADGAQGLKALEQPGINVIICDVNMPVMDGLTMCSMIQASPTLPKLPIFMLTTEASPELKEVGKKAGVKFWITKPFKAAKLIEVVKKVVA